ncbi:MAG: SRPBCC domain-containing protein [Candidatus Manganitrophus sp. SA1]|nr:SRPBCC domain-containing protein [Candidatus Manganitrophus morganii]
MKPSEIKLQITRFFPASREKIFEAWTRPDKIMQWFAPGEMTIPLAEVDLRVGGRYRIQMKDPDGGETHTTTGVYKEILPPQRLVFTWRWEGPDSQETEVTIELKEKDGGTELTLTHARFANTESRDKHQHGWNGCLENLSRFLEKSK